jgi:nucleoid-associated protein YgaU
MGLLAFIKEAGEKLFGGKEAKAAQDAAAQAPTPENLARQAEASAAAIVAHLDKHGLYNGSMQVRYDVASAVVTVSGQVGSQETREKVLLCCGNVAGVASVDDQLVVPVSSPAAQFHTVVSGDNLSKIAKRFYGDADKYPVIFEANKPMLAHPDKIYPGQVLRIPPL